MDAPLPNSPIQPPASAKSVNALVLNCLVPGVGSLYGGQVGIGTAQLGLMVAGIFLIPALLLGIPLILAAYLWSIYTGITQIRN